MGRNETSPGNGELRTSKYSPNQRGFTMFHLLRDILGCRNMYKSNYLQLPGMIGGVVGVTC